LVAIPQKLLQAGFSFCIISHSVLDYDWSHALGFSIRIQILEGVVAGSDAPSGYRAGAPDQRRRE
jgi:hypothetical protein